MRGHQVAYEGLIERGRHDGVLSLSKWGTYTSRVDAVRTVVVRRLFLVLTKVVVTVKHLIAAEAPRSNMFWCRCQDDERSFTMSLIKVYRAGLARTRGRATILDPG